MLRLTIPSIEEDDINAVCDVLSTGSLIQGVHVAAFEHTIANYTGSKFAIAVSNCTAALHIALLAIDVNPGDLVIVTTYSWIATANVIELCYAQPIFVDINPNTYNMDPNCLESVLNRVMADKSVGNRVKAIIPVHTFGQLADMVDIAEIANRYNLPVIEDAACALGAKLHERQAGTWGTMGCFSFHPRKAITTGEGGMIITNDNVLDKRLRALRNHGQEPESNPPEFVMPGFNYRMTEFQAALGFTQMTKLDRIIEARRQIAANYDELLRDTHIQSPVIPSESWHVYQSYVALLPKEIGDGDRRSELITHLKYQGIETSIGTIHMPMTSYFRARYGYQQGDFPATDLVSACSLTLPLHEKLSRDNQEFVVKSLVENIVKT
jgi:dTDP-4-amino-4,6-dideoxygalactose transaminase